jgi:3D (Asp-Asp-Asp) domain-containing protein
METTAYCQNGRTASGAWTHPGVIAATLPFGTHIWVPGYGTGVVADRGAAVGPGQLDLFMPDCNRAIQWGRRVVKVHIRR